MSATVKSRANHPPTFTESDRAQAIPPRATMTTAAMPNCRRRAHQRANHARNPAVGLVRPGGATPARGEWCAHRAKGAGRTASVVSSPVPRPAQTERHGKAAQYAPAAVCQRPQGSASITATPRGDTEKAADEPEASVCSRKMRSRSLDRAPTALRIASMSMRCSRCACMAMATPMAPSTMATRQIRLRIAVALSRPWLSAGFPSLKSMTCASGKNRFNLLAYSRWDRPLAGSCMQEALRWRGCRAPAGRCDLERRARS